MGVACINLKWAKIEFADWEQASWELETRGWPGESVKVGGQNYSLHIPFPCLGWIGVLVRVTKSSQRFGGGRPYADAEPVSQLVLVYQSCRGG